MVSSQHINRDRLAAALCGTPENYPFYLGKSWSSRARKRIEKVVQKVQAPVQKYYGAAGKAVGYIAPVFGAAVGGTAGAAAGATIGTAAVGATTKGNREAKARAALRFAKYGGMVTVATGLTSLATGTGLTQGLLTKGGPFMPGDTVPGIPSDTGAPYGTSVDPVTGELTSNAPPSSGGGSVWTDFFGKAGSTALTRYEKGLTKDGVESGIPNPYETSITSDGGAGGSGGSGGGPGGDPGGGKAGTESGKPDTQYLIMGGIALAAAYFLLKR